MSGLLEQALAERILVVDGAMGTSLWPMSGGGCCDAICLLQPDFVAAIHKSFIVAGADILTTNTFNANSVSLTGYGLAPKVDRLNKVAVRIARQAANGCSRKIWVAGCVGATACMLSIGKQEVGFECLKEAYVRQMSVLIEEGVDLLLIETITDLLNAKAAADAAIEAMRLAGRNVQIIFSATMSQEGRLLSGHSLADFVSELAFVHPLAFGLNCGFGIKSLMPGVERLAELTEAAIWLCPNAGLPDKNGVYRDEPESMAASMEFLARKGLLNMAGGCCGTEPEHIRAIADAVKGRKPRSFHT